MSAYGILSPGMSLKREIVLYLLLSFGNSFANDRHFMRKRPHVMTLCGKAPSFETRINYEDETINGKAAYGGKLEQLEIWVEKARVRSLVGCEIFLEKSKTDGESQTW